MFVYVGLYRKIRVLYRVAAKISAAMLDCLVQLLSDWFFEVFTKLQRLAAVQTVKATSTARCWCRKGMINVRCGIPSKHIRQTPVWILVLASWNKIPRRPLVRSRLLRQRSGAAMRAELPLVANPAMSASSWKSCKGWPRMKIKKLPAYDVCKASQMATARTKNWIWS